MADKDDRSFAPRAEPPGLGQEDHPQEDWGEATGEGAVPSANHARRPDKTESERGQGAKTRQHNKDTFSRRI